MKYAVGGDEQARPSAKAGFHNEDHRPCADNNPAWCRWFAGPARPEGPATTGLPATLMQLLNGSSTLRRASGGSTRGAHYRESERRSVVRILGPASV